MQYDTKHSIKLGRGKGDDYELVAARANETIELTDEEAKPLLAKGAISKRGQLAKAPSQPAPISDLTKEELEEQAKELEIDVDAIEGSGAKGAVLKDDLIKAIQAKAAGK